MAEQFANFAQGTLAAPISARQTSITLNNAASFPLLGNFRLVIQAFDPTTQAPVSQPEIMIATAVAGSRFTVTRGAEGTIAMAWAAGVLVVHVATAAVMQALASGSGVSSIGGVTGAILLGTNLSITGSTLNASGTGGGGFTNTAVSNGSPYTAGTGQNIYTIYNSSGASYTFNLNAAPATNDVCVIIDAGLTAAAHPITIQGNGKTISAGGASGTSYQIGSNGGAVSLSWDGTQWSQYA